MHSYICIAAFHLGTIDEPRGRCDVGAEPEDDEWWTRLEDGWMDPDVHDRRKMLAERLSSNTDLVLIPGKPWCINSSILNAVPIYVPIMYLCT